MNTNANSRLRRLNWLFADQPVYFLTACTAERKEILAHTELHRAFVIFARQAQCYGTWTGRYVIMPNHLHLFAAFSTRGPSLSQWMKSLKNSLSKSLRARGVTAPHWQKGFFDHILRSKESYAEKWEYVRLNPVRAGLVRSPEEWPYQGQIQELSGDSL